MNGDEQAIRALIATWIRAAEAGDAERVLGLLADDVVFLTPGAPPMRKPAFAAAQHALQEVQLRITSAIQEIRILGEWAYCWNRLTVVMTPRVGGSPVTRAGDSLSILQKKSDSWLLVRDANLVTAASPVQ
ncbi:MAG TPA: SgcJ/EcaC family oxidoreductase [Steroidobacteraceae bacterium]|jgi:uncharacterized protein (TIGR02246 family)|nr:SgcJ/EcaC family oxidoreductase [Steroidobacteraceae bacterium]